MIKREVQIIQSIQDLPFSATLLNDASEVQLMGTFGVSCPFETMPIEYVRFARADLNSGDKRGTLNAFHNAKRAIDCQMDRMLWNLGIGRSRLSMPRKFEILREVNANAPQMLAHLIKKRNLLEHEYKSVTVDQAAEAVDIAELYVRATDAIARFRTDCAMVTCTDSATFLTLAQQVVHQKGQRFFIHSNGRDEGTNAISIDVFRSDCAQSSTSKFTDWYFSDQKWTQTGSPPFSRAERIYVTRTTWELFMLLIKYVVVALKDEDW